MTSPLLYTKGDAHIGLIADYSSVTLRHDVEIAPLGYLPTGTRGVVVFTYDEGAAYEVEFAKPFRTVVTLTSDDIEPVSEPTGERDSADDLLGGSS